MKYAICIALSLLTGCGSSASESTKPQAQPQEANAKQKPRKKTPGAAQSTNPETGEETTDSTGGNDAETEVDGQSDGQSEGNIDGEPPPLALNEGKKYFEETIFPLFTATCASCHADPRMNPPQRGPLTIFSYDTMRDLLTDGNSASDNRLARKVRNIDPHGGGNRCNAGPTGTPCQEMMEWWRLELGQDSGLDGRISSVSIMGDVLGYAVDTRDETKTLTVRIMVDGQLAAETQASKPGPDGNYAGDHAFNVQLPPALRDGKERVVAAFVGDRVVGPMFKYTAYAPKDAGRAYFTATIAPALNARCARCHAIQYETQYGALISPPPHKGGTATTNELIDYSAGANNHPGGNLCGNKNGSPCNLLQTWWNMEFGP